MRPLIVANIETLEGRPFIVAMLYEDGQLADGIILPCETDAIGLLAVKYLADTHRIEFSEMWTSSSGLYRETLTRAGVLGVIKHPSDTRSTRRAIEQDAETLRDLYDIKPLTPRPQPPKWRTMLYRAMSAITNYVKGDYEYEV